MHFYQLDHSVLTVTDLTASLKFYSEVLQIPIITFGTDRKALQIGHQKINLHVAEDPIAPHAKCPTPGSADICLLIDVPINNFITVLETAGVVIELGPVQRTGAQSQLWSIYLRDPDGNLIEIANPITPGNSAFKNTRTTDD